MISARAAAHLRQTDVRQRVPVEEIARLAGQSTSRTTEIVYRHQLRPVMEKGAQAMDQIFPRTA